MMRANQIQVRRLFLACILLPLIGFLSIHMLVYDLLAPAADHSKVNSPVHSRVKRQDPGIGDESQLPYEVRSSRLPMMPDKASINHRYMPTIGNGHIATTPFQDFLYMNGLFEGTGADSQRAKIPAIIMGRVRLTNKKMDERAIRKYIFSARDGVFTETIDCDFARIEHRMYMHSKHIRLFVSDIYAKRKPDAHGGGILSITYPNLDSQLMNFNRTQKRYHSNWQASGRTRHAEAGAQTRGFHMFWTERLTQISLRGNEVVNETFIMSVDQQEASARSEFDIALRLFQDKGHRGHYELFRQHVDTWAKVWKLGHIKVEGGDNQVAKIAHFSQYYLLSSLPAQLANMPPQHSEIFFGLSRTGLGRGGDGQDYRGHVFWDSELYLLPAVLLFHPELAKQMLRYRATLAGAAANYATNTGSKGLRYPWESAASGNEVTPDGCVACRERQIHVTAAVGWAIRQYYSATRDHDFITNPDYAACDMMKGIAEFWADKAVYNSSKGRYDIHNVMGPDDWHPNVNNNAYTNAAASLAIHFARYMACMCDRTERDEVPDEWIHKALYLTLPYDNVKRLHYQYEGFERETNNTIKQADTVLLTYPLNWNMSRDIMRNDLEFYELLTSDRTPAMTWSFYTVGWKWVQDEAKMMSYFLKSYQDYVIQPFKIWTEYNERSLQDQRESSVNFLPGMGAFLQSLIYGFAGVRVRPQMIEFHDPRPAPDTHRLRLLGFDYLQSSFNIEIEAHSVTVEVLSIGDLPLVLKENGTTLEPRELHPGDFITIKKPKDGFYIYTSKSISCHHPRDYIYMPWGYSPFINSAPGTYAYTVLLFVVTLIVGLCNCYR